MKSFRVFTKLFFTHSTIGLVSLLSLSVIFYFLFQNALVQRTTDQLSSINILKKKNIEEYFDEIKKSLLFLSEQQNLVSDSILFSELTILKQLYDFESILVTDNQHRKVMSIFNDSLLIKVVEDIDMDQKQGKFEIIEASSHIPIVHTVLVYVLPISVNKTDNKRFVFIQDNFEKIQRILQETTGMGNTGESYLVGSDFKMRSASRFIPDRPPLTIKVNTTSSNVFTGSDPSGIILDYRGIRVLSVYRKIDNPYLNWVIVSEIDFEEAMNPMIQWRNYIVVTTVIIMMVIIGITFFISRAISKPILYLKNVITQLSKGVIPSDKVNVVDTSEVGQIAQAISELIEGLKRTTEFADEIGVGRFNTSFTTLSDKDTLGQSLIRMRDRLKILSAEQIRLVREKASALLEGQEKERKRIVQDLHDGVGQLLTGIRLRVQMLEQEEKLKHEVLSLVSETIAEVKRISYNVMPNAIVDFGLEAALKGLCDNVKKYTSITIDFSYVKEFEHLLSFEISIAAFRIVQEGFNNIMKHAEATHAELYILDSQNELYILLRDNGLGFNEGALGSTSSFGLRSMRERAKLLNGDLDIHSLPGQGTTIEVTIPINQIDAGYA